MAITQPALARAVAFDLARIAPPEARIRRIWIWNQFGTVEPDREYVELTVQADPADARADDQFQAAIAALHDLHPDANILVHSFTSRALGDLPVAGELRPDAEEIDLGAE